MDLENNKTDHLNDQQIKVVDHVIGPLQVVAGAGSGKTTVLMHRIKNIIDKKLALPKEILIVTFTKKAAEEIKERLSEMYGDIGREVTAGTFHSICMQKILKIYPDEDFLESVGLGDRWEGMDEKDQSSLVRQTMKEMTDEDIEYCNEEEITAKKFEAFLSLSRSMGVDQYNYLIEKKKVIKDNDKDNPLFWMEEHLSNEGIEDFQKFEEVALRFWNRYEQLCRSKNSVDFDDILLLSNKLLEERSNVSKELSEKWKFLMLDEYQDTNTVQMKIMDNIAKHHNNICVVGDDQQSIYGFRGSNINVIRGFGQRYPNSKLLTLSYNYRSSSEILKTSNSIASAMTQRLSNEFLRSPINKHNDRPNLRGFVSDLEEAIFISRDIKRKIAEGVKPQDISILYRNRSVKMSIEKQLLEQDVKYTIYNDTSFFSRKEVLDTVALIRFMFRSWSALSAIRFMDGANLPTSGDYILKHAEKYGTSPHDYMKLYAKPSVDIVGEKHKDSEEEKETKLFKKVQNLFTEIDNCNCSTIDTNSLILKSEHINNEIKSIIDKIDNNYYVSGSIKKSDIVKSGTTIRKAIKNLKKNDKIDETKSFLKEISNLLVSSVQKSDEVRLFVEIMNTATNVAKICDEPNVDKSTLLSLPKMIRNAIARTWETYMASSLEKYVNQTTTSDKDSDNLESRYRNVEYILDRFVSRIKDAINDAENNNKGFSDVIDLAIDDLTVLVDKSPDENKVDNVQMMTMHASKGLEFPHVYVMGMVKEIMPGPKAIGNPALEQEELRLFYVACTRAKENLTISYSSSRRKYDGSIEQTKGSPFLRNIVGSVDFYNENQKTPVTLKSKSKKQDYSM